MVSYILIGKNIHLYISFCISVAYMGVDHRTAHEDDWDNTKSIAEEYHTERQGAGEEVHTTRDEVGIEHPHADSREHCADDVGKSIETNPTTVFNYQ